ncbi:MAG TPA: DUF1918 domain-containing protein [Acidimicrobiales bacterium]|nr:DUF1918 domain-containing protein [Acidimicrobiales bacterium]
MQAQVSDRLVVHGSRGARAGVILELVDGLGPQRYRVRWNDGHESWIAPGPDAVIEHDEEADRRAEWEAAKAARHARTQGWRRGITAGVGREASLAQRKIGTLADTGS